MINDDITFVFGLAVIVPERTYKTCGTRANEAKDMRTCNTVCSNTFGWPHQTWTGKMPKIFFPLVSTEKSGKPLAIFCGCHICPMPASTGRQINDVMILYVLVLGHL